ncbi:MAG: GcrA family cell cycle regulator [Hyphomicrobiaceae bacterium]
MPSKSVAKLTKLTELEERRRPNMQFIDASNCASVSDQEIPMNQRRTIITVEQSNCRWPYGDPSSASFFLCGATTQAGQIYCPHHMTKAYTAKSQVRLAMRT